MTTHPLNCSTCAKFWNPQTGMMGCKNSGSIWNMTKEQVQQISDVGCASHIDKNGEPTVCVCGLTNEQCKELRQESKDW